MWDSVCACFAYLPKEDFVRIFCLSKIADTSLRALIRSMPPVSLKLKDLCFEDCLIRIEQAGTALPDEEFGHAIGNAELLAEAFVLFVYYLRHLQTCTILPSDSPSASINAWIVRLGEIEHLPLPARLRIFPSLESASYAEVVDRIQQASFYCQEFGLSITEDVASTVARLRQIAFKARFLLRKWKPSASQIAEAAVHMQSDQTENGHVSQSCSIMKRYDLRRYRTINEDLD